MNFSETQKVLLHDARAAVKESGIDPDKVAHVPLFRDMLKMYMGGQWSRAQFQENCRKLGFINKSICLEQMQA